MTIDPQSYVVSLMMKEISNVITPTFLQQWDEFSTEFTRPTGEYPMATQSNATHDINDTVDDAIQPTKTQQAPTATDPSQSILTPIPAQIEMCDMINCNNQTNRPPPTPLYHIHCQH